MAQDSVGTARLDIVVDTSQFDVAIQRAQSRVSSMSQAAQKDYAALGAAEKRRVDRLIQQADTSGLARDAQIAYNAALRVNGPLLDDITRRLKANQAATQASNKELSKYGLTAAQQANALRGVPAQITDIVTQLQGGANPLTVILQQGGQLRDMFGGIRPAAAALTGQLAAMINPTTVLTAAVGALALAWYQSQRGMEAAGEALILTGNYARMSTDDIAALAREMDDLAGVTSGSATAALTQVAATGRFTGEQLALVAKAAEQMRVATGRAIEETVDDFAALAKDPVEGLLKLNETQHFLTQTQLDSIRVLKEQGREQEAVTEAIRIYAETVDGRTAQVVENFGLVSGALHGIKNAATEAWDSVITGMRDADREAKESVGALQRFFASLRAGPGPAGFFGLQSSLADPVPVGPAQRDATVDSAAARKALEERKKTQQEWERITEQNLTARQRQLAEEARIIAAGKTLGKEQAEVDRELTASRARFAEAEARRNRTTRTTDPTDQIISRLRQQIALNEEQAQSEDKLTATERLLVQVRTNLDKLGTKASASKRATVDALMAEAKASGEAAEKALAEAKAKEALARQNAILQQQAQNRARGNEIDLLGFSRGADAVEQMRRRLDIDREYEDELKRLGDRAVAEDKATWDEMAANAARHRDEQLRLEEQYQEDRVRVMGDWRNGARRAFDDLQARAADVAGLTSQLFTGAFTHMEDAIVKFAQTGKLSVKDLLSSIGADLSRFFAQKAVLQFAQLLASGFGGGSAPSTDFASSFGNNTGWLTTNAKGGVYQTPSLHKFANQVHDTPKLFAFAKGAGVFGEAGPEAIMPLTRTAGGQLGVRAVGGAGSAPVTYIEVNIDGNGQSSSNVRGDEQNGKELGRMIEGAVNDVLIRQMQQGGLLYNWRRN